MSTTNGPRSDRASDRGRDPFRRLPGPLRSGLGWARRAGLHRVLGSMLVVLAIAAAAAAAAVSAPSALGAPVAASTFPITAKVSGYPSCTGSGLLAPGVTRCLTYTVTNTNTVPIVVTRLAIASVTGTATCPGSAVDLSATTFTGSLSIQPKGSASTSGLPISLVDTAGNQNACKGAAFTLTLTGTATAGR